MLKNHFRIAARALVRHKVFTLIHVFGLALGICACIVIYLISRYEFDFDAFHPDKERIFRVGGSVQENEDNHAPRVYSEAIPSPVPSALREQIPGLEVVVGYYPYRSTVTIRENNKDIRNFTGASGAANNGGTIITEPGYFKIFTYDWLAGNPATSLTRPFSVVLSKSKASQYFGSLSFNEIIGKEVIYNDSLRVNVSGIVKDWDKNTDFPFTDFISFSTIKASFLKNLYHTDDWHFTPGIPWISSFVKLSKGKDPAQAGAQVEALFTDRFKADPFLRLIRFGIQLQPLPDVHFNAAYNDGIRKAHLPTLYGLMGVAFFILLIAVFNFINLSTAQSLQRAKEMGVRKILGSSRMNLIFQHLTETFLLCLFAECVAVLMVNPVLSAFSDYIPPAVKFHLLHPVTLLFILSVMLTTCLLAGLYPAWMLSSTSAAQSLKKMTTEKTGSWSIRKPLIVFQFTVSLIFIISSIVIRSQIRFMLDADFGFNPDAIITIANQNDPGNKLSVLKEKINQLPGVNGTVLQGHAPMGDAMLQLPVQYKGKTDREMMVSVQAGTKDFIPFYQMKLIAGRNLVSSDSLQEYVINATCSRALGFARPEEAIGQLLYWNSKTYPIVGVIADFYEGSFHNSIGPVVIGHIPQFENSLATRLDMRNDHKNGASKTILQIQRLWKEIYPLEPFDYRFLNDSIAGMYKKDQQASWLMTVTMLIAIFISCTGLFGLITFVAKQRTREIGIRKVLGASVSSIVAMLSNDFLKLVFLSIPIASPVAYFCMHRWLQNFAYRINISWWIFALAGLASVIIALLTVGFQAIKAAVANPVQSLRSQ